MRQRNEALVKTLAKHIATQLDKRPFCVVFEDDFKRCLPSSQTRQEE